jgi:Transglycosylase SLT domain
MLQVRNRLKRVPRYSRGLIRAGALVLVIALTALPTSSPASVTIARPIRGVPAETRTSSPPRHVAARVRRARVVSVVAELADFTNAPTPSDGYVVTLIHQDFPARAWHDAEAVAWCESKFRTTDIGFDSNGTHDRGLFQLNDGGTEQYLMAMIGQNPKNVNLAFNPVLNVRAAALLYARDGWSQWSCESAI